MKHMKLRIWKGIILEPPISWKQLKGDTFLELSPKHIQKRPITSLITALIAKLQWDILSQVFSKKQK